MIPRPSKDPKDGGVGPEPTTSLSQKCFQHCCDPATRAINATSGFSVTRCCSHDGSSCTKVSAEYSAKEKAYAITIYAITIYAITILLPITILYPITI